MRAGVEDGGGRGAQCERASWWGGTGVCWLLIALGFGGALALGPLPEAAPWSWVLLAGAGLAWWAALVRARRRPPAWGWVWVGALVLRALALAGEPQTSDDLERYVWEGALVLEGRSPYAWAPDDPALAAVRERRPATYAAMNNTAVSAAYPPLTQALCALAVAAAGGPERADEGRSRLALRLLYGAFDLALLWPLGWLLRARGLPPGLALAWGWCPLVALEFAGAAHFDAAGLFFTCLGLALWGRGRALGAGLSLGAAALIKFLPVVALVFLRGAKASRAWSAALLCALLAYAPLLWLDGGSAGLFRGLSTYGLAWESTSLLYRFVEPPLELLFARGSGWIGPHSVGRGLVVLAFGATLLVARWRRVEPFAATGWALGAFVVLSPTLHPWYVCWIVPFLCLRPLRGAPLLVALAPLFYWPLRAWRADAVWVEPAWLWPAVALPCLLLCALDAARPLEVRA